MKEKKWQKFTVQSVILLAVVLAVSIFQQGGLVRESGKRVMADGTAVLEETKEPEEIQEVQSVKSVKSDITHIKKRSSTYIEIQKSMITTGAGIYLYDNYINSEVCMVIDGMTQKNFLKNGIIRYNRGDKFIGNANYKNKQDIVESIDIISAKTKDGLYKTEVKIKTKRLYAPELYETDDSYYISLAVPKNIYDKIVVIDAGHGGIDEGTKSFRGHYEKDYNLMVLKELKNLLDTSDNIKAYYTRLSDEKVSKVARTSLANNLDADLFISIHCNSSEYGNGEPYGVEALYSKRKPRNSRLENKKLAEILLDNVAEKVNSKKRGVIRREGLYIMHHSKVPASIIEIGYMSNKSDLKYIIKKSGQKKAAEGIYNGILEALG